MSRTPTFTEVIRAALDARAANVHTALPASVISYDSAAQTVNVQPLVKRVVQDFEEGLELVESLPQIPNVPVAFPRSGGDWITFPIAAGDTGLLVFCERSIDTWRATNRESDPGSVRMHNLSDAVFLPGLSATAAALTTSATATVINVASALHLGGLNPAEFVALATKVLNELQAFKADLDAVKATFDAHVHILTLTAGTGTAAPPAVPIATPHTPASVAATKVKAV